MANKTKPNYSNFYSALKINQQLWTLLYSIGEVEDYKKKQILFTENDLAIYAYIIIEGGVIIYARKSIVDIVTAGDSIGVTLQHDEKNPNNTYPLSAKTITQTKALKIPLQQFNHLIYKDSECTKYTLEQFRKKMNFVQSMKCFEKFPVEIRLANFLLKKHELLSTTYLTKNIIGQCTGISCETVIRQFSEWSKKNIIQIKLKKIDILDTNYLKNLINN